MVFVDASALIAIIAGESDADTLADALDSDPGRLCSSLAAWETVAGLCRSYTLAVEDAHDEVRRFLDVGNIQLVPIAAREWHLATQAYARFGKGRHPASLNMGDCFAYACAKANGAKLLYKGNDFALTDMA